ncbi:MAG: universal stress protein [Deltaproteobacteria bacterium]|nr:universal stress protein [Deltaproteobacteria bacterium]
MIPKIRRILYATDLSANSAYAFRYAMNSAIMHDAKIVILYVLEAMKGMGPAMLDGYLGEEERKRIYDERVTDVMERTRKRLEVFRQKEAAISTEAADLVESIEIVEGYPAEEILRMADEHNCDVIIMGTHGKGIISHTFLGSVAEWVLRRVRKPVFIIPLPKGETDITFHDI